MQSPFCIQRSQPGKGQIVVDLSPLGVAHLSTLTYAYPLKLISPSVKGCDKSVLVFLLTYGGGLVAGDRIDLQITVSALSKLSLVTQGSTKLFKAPQQGVESRQLLTVSIEGGGSLLYLPDPLQPFDDSAYEQTQVFKLESLDSNLCVLDWVTAGRRARGENWGLRTWKSSNEIWTKRSRNRGSTLDDDWGLSLRDNVLLTVKNTSPMQGNLATRMEGLGVFGTLMLRGPLFKPLGEFFLREFTLLPRIGARQWSSEEAVHQLSNEESWRVNRHLREKSQGVIWTAAQVRGSVLVKFGALDVEPARHWLRDMLLREGSCVAHFGEHSLLCLR